jgi:tetratricopeptide (TPR) repeat protein
MQAEDPNVLMRAAEAHYVARRFAAALPPVEQVLRIVPGHPAVLHLHGLILSGLGRLAEAHRALVLAHRGLPGDAQIANNLGNLLARMGEPAAALAAYDAAIRNGFGPARLHRATILDELGRRAEARAELARIDPPSADALVALASIERDEGDLNAARVALDAALAIDAGHALARVSRARIAADACEPDAGIRHRALLIDHPNDHALLIGYVAAAETAEARSDAMRRIDAALAGDPGWHEGHAALAQARWEAGERDGFAASYEPAITARPRDKALWQGYVATLGRVDDFAAAAAICRRAEAATGDPTFAASAVAYLGAAGRIDEAEAILARLPAGILPAAALAKHRLLCRDPAGAEPLLAATVAAAPGDIEAWALRGIAWELLGDDRAEWLHGQPGLVAVAPLPLAADRIAAIVDQLRAAHVRSTLRAGQSVRGGTQTHGDLFSRTEPEIALLRAALAEAVERYRRASPPADPRHPLLRHRDAPFALAGGWSIRLTAGGFHVRHMHPRGILSAASYWVLPPADAADRHAGWLEIGGAPDYLGLDLAPRHLIEPRVGTLALFPSTLHHGTRPFPAGERISVAFDVAPGPRDQIASPLPRPS